MIADVFVLWTPTAILMAFGGGLSMAIIIRHLGVPVQRPVFWTMVAGLLWLTPQIVTRALDQSLPAGAWLRTAGGLVMFMCAFVPGLIVGLCWRRKCQE